MIKSFLVRVATGLMLSVVALSSACKEDLTEQEEVTVQLTAPGVWKSPTVTVDGVDRSDLYKDLSIDFGNGVYSAKNGMPVWKESGKWKFLNDEAHFLILDDDVEMEILSITDKRLELSFQWSIDSFEAGRIKSVKGKNKFTLIR